MARPKKPRLNLDENEVKEYYSNHTRKETAEHFNATDGEMRVFLKEHAMQRSSSGFKDQTTAKHRNEAMKEFAKNHDAVMRARKLEAQTMKDKYGDATYNATLMNKKRKRQSNGDEAS